MVNGFNWILVVSDDWLDPCPVGVVMTRLTCSFLAGVLCPAAAGSCSGWFWGDVVSAAFPFSFSLFSCGCLASESAPDSVVMVNHAGVGKRRGKGGKLDESADLLWSDVRMLFQPLCDDKLLLWCRCRDEGIVWQQNKNWNKCKWLRCTQVSVADHGKCQDCWYPDNTLYNKLYDFSHKNCFKILSSRDAAKDYTHHLTIIFSINHFICKIWENSKCIM